MAGTTHGSGAMVIPETIDFLALHHLHWAAGISGGHRSRLDVLRSRSVCDGSLRHGVRRRLLVLLVLVACHALLLPQLWRLRSSRNKTGASFKRPPRQQRQSALRRQVLHSSTFTRSLIARTSALCTLRLAGRRGSICLTSECSCRRCASKSPPPTLHHRYGVFFQVAPRSNESTESRGGESCWRR